VVTATSAPSFMRCAGASPADGALRQNPNTLHAAVTTVDGVGGRGSGAPLIWSSGSEVGLGQRASSPPDEPAQRTAGTPTVISHSY
jgi:hypothetical protein